MSEQPIIGLTTYGRDEKGNFMLPGLYVDAVRRAGGIPVLVPPGDPHLNQLLALLDGVVLSGGGDVDPQYYGGQMHETIYMLDAERDESELFLANRILKIGLPTLGICRGTQVLNVALGGTLIAHLPDVVGETVLHRVPPRLAASHPVSVTAGSKLASILQTTETVAASWHHQAIDKVAPGLQVVAQAPDGIIEAVEMPEHPWLVAIQWHPEITAQDDPVQQKLFDALVAAARTAKLQRTSSGDL